MDVRPWHEIFKELRPSDPDGRPISVEDVYWNARRQLEDRGEKPVSLSLLQKHLSHRWRNAPPSQELLILAAAAIGQPPEVFVEYRLAQVRASLQPEIVGLAAAVCVLERIEPLLAEQTSGASTRSGDH